MIGIHIHLYHHRLMNNRILQKHISITRRMRLAAKDGIPKVKDGKYVHKDLKIVYYKGKTRSFSIFLSGCDVFENGELIAPTDGMLGHLTELELDNNQFTVTEDGDEFVVMPQNKRFKIDEVIQYCNG
jgi:hypothetical protein